MRGADFPYVREPGRCDLCDELVGEENLVRVEVSRGRAGHKRGSPSTLRRAIYVCDRHDLAPAGADGDDPGRGQAA
jgi:hypothetical protein